jgi:hypothetical protein
MFGTPSIRLRAALLALALSTACGSESESDGGDATVICAQVQSKLDEINQTLQCEAGGEVLAEQCRRGLAGRPACRPRIQELLDCVQNRPLTEWECHDIGQYPAMSTDACSAEDDAINACFSE